MAACPTHNQGLQVCTPYGPVPPSLGYYRSGMICACGMFPASWMHLAPYKPSLSLRVILRVDANHLRKPHLFRQLKEWNQTWVRVWDRFKTAQCPTVRRAVINRSNTSTSCFDSISDMHTQTRLAWNTWTTCLKQYKSMQLSEQRSLLTTANAQAFCTCCNLSTNIVVTASYQLHASTIDFVLF